MQSDPLDRSETSEKPIPGCLPEAGILGRFVDRVAILFAIGIVIAMVILIMEVILRYVFNAPTIWAHEMTVFICSIMFVFGGLYGIVQNSHIRVILIYEQLSTGARRIFNIVISLISAVATGFFTYAAWLMTKRAIFTPDGEIRLQTSGSAWDPPTPALLKLFMLLVLILMTVQFLILAYKYARQRNTRPGFHD